MAKSVTIIMSRSALNVFYQLLKPDDESLKLGAAVRDRKALGYFCSSITKHKDPFSQSIESTISMPYNLLFQRTYKEKQFTISLTILQYLNEDHSTALWAVRVLQSKDFLLHNRAVHSNDI